MLSIIKKFFLNDYCILSLILINAVVMFMQCYFPTCELLQGIDTALLFLFVVEVIVKVHEYHWTGYWSDHWNKFDFSVTMIALVAFIQSCLPRFGMSSLEFILALRVFRGFRFFRLFRFVKGMDSIIIGCKRAILSTYAIVLAFLLSAFIWSIITCNLFSKTSPEYFGDPLTSFYSIFRLFTIEGWYDVPNAVANTYDSIFIQTVIKLFFSVLLFLGGIIGMSFINSIIVDAMASDNNDQVLKRIKELEEKIDKLLKEEQNKQENK